MWKLVDSHSLFSSVVPYRIGLKDLGGTSNGKDDIVVVC